MVFENADAASSAAAGGGGPGAAGRSGSATEVPKIGVAEMEVSAFHHVSPSNVWKYLWKYHFFSSSFAGRMDEIHHFSVGFRDIVCDF